MNISKQISPSIRVLIVIAVMTATLMQVLDTTIVNVALPHMEGSLSASPDQITWILTSYLVAAAIFMPLTGYFTDRLGQKKYLLISIAGFVAASALCGAATNIGQIVVFRLLQGIFGAALVPLSQAIMADIFPEEERGYAMALWGIGVMVGPILGPTLGGYLTDIATWRWNFYINIPFGILCFLLTWQILPDTPKKSRRMDWPGLILISTTIGSVQYFLDRGNQDDWFSSTGICITAFLMVICFLGFLLHNIDRKNKTNVFDLSIFADRNFAVSSCLLGVYCLSLYGAMVILPLMLEGIFNYPVLTTGLVMAPRGIGGMISMLLAGMLLAKFDPRKVIMLGVLISIAGMYISTYYNLDISPGWIIGPLLLQGFGLGLIFVPLSAMAFSTLPGDLRSEAAGLFSLLRTIGGSVGISIVSTLLARLSQFEWNQLGGHIQPFNIATSKYLAVFHLKATSPQGIAILGNTLEIHTQMLAYINIFAFITWSIVLMIPLVLLFKKPLDKNPVSPPAAD
jgi:DHA2 family multidrug resistance protein